MYLTTPSRLSVSLKRIYNEEKTIASAIPDAEICYDRSCGDVQVWPMWYYINPACDLLKFVYFFSEAKSHLQRKDDNYTLTPKIEFTIIIQQEDRRILQMYVDFAQLNRTGCNDNLDSKPTSVGVFDIYEWGTADGYIDNILLDIELPEEEVIRGEAFEGGVTKTIILSENATENLSFDYKLTTDGDIRVILRAPDWNGFYGDFTFDANGLVWSNQTGITTEKLEDGYIRVYVDFAQLNRTGCNDNLDSKPASVGVFDIYKWGTADGYIDNIQLDIASSEEEEPVIRGEVYNAGEKTNYMIDEGNYATISFEYRLTTDGEINVMLRSPSDTPYYGGFKFNANGETQDYAGVECEKLNDGYIRVTVTIADVERTNNKDNLDNIPATVSKICIYRDSTASGYIDNIQYVVAEETEILLLLQKCNGTNASCSARDYSNMYFSTTPFTSASDTLTLVVKTDYTSIKLRGMSNIGDEWSGSGVTKTLEDLGNGWKTVTWTLSEIVGSNDVTTMNGFKIEGLVDGTDILMKDILINGQTDWVGEFASTYHGVVTQQQIEE